MKAKKAIKKIKKAQSLMSKVVKQYAQAEPTIRDSLGAAGDNLSRARTLMQSNKKTAGRPRKGQVSGSQSAKRELSQTDEADE